MKKKNLKKKKCLPEMTKWGAGDPLCHFRNIKKIFKKKKLNLYLYRKY